MKIRIKRYRQSHPFGVKVSRAMGLAFIDFGRIEIRISWNMIPWA